MNKFLNKIQDNPYPEQYNIAKNKHLPISAEETSFPVKGLFKYDTDYDCLKALKGDGQKMPPWRQVGSQLPQRDGSQGLSKDKLDDIQYRSVNSGISPVVIMIDEWKCQRVATVAALQSALAATPDVTLDRFVKHVQSRGLGHLLQNNVGHLSPSSVSATPQVFPPVLSSKLPDHQWYDVARFQGIVVNAHQIIVNQGEHRGKLITCYHNRVDEHEKLVNFVDMKFVVNRNVAAVRGILEGTRVYRIVPDDISYCGHISREDEELLKQRSLCYETNAKNMPAEDIIAEHTRRLKEFVAEKNPVALSVAPVVSPAAPISLPPAVKAEKREEECAICLDNKKTIVFVHCHGEEFCVSICPNCFVENKYEQRLQNHEEVKCPSCQRAVESVRTKLPKIFGLEL